MTIMQFDREIALFREKYPEYKDWFMDTPEQLRNIASNLDDNGWHSDSDRLDFLADELENIVVNT